MFEVLLRVRQACDHPYLVLLGKQRNKSHLKASTINKQFEEAVQLARQLSESKSNNNPDSDNNNIERLPDISELEERRDEEELLFEEEIGNNDGILCDLCMNEMDEVYQTSGCPHKLCQSVSFLPYLFG